MIIEERKIDTVSVLAIKGDFWSTGGWELYEKVKEAISGDTKFVIADISKIERMNSRGIGVLVACLKSLREKDGDLKIVGANENVITVLKIVNLYTYLDLYKTVDEAIENIRKA